MSGTANAEQYKQMIDLAHAQRIVEGRHPGGFSLGRARIVSLQNLASPVDGGPARSAAPTIDPALLQTALDKTNAAAATTPSAVSGKPTGANTPLDAIASAAKDLPSLATLQADVKALEAGATGTLHWWGWTLTLNESATEALVRLLGPDLAAGLSVIALALAPISAPLAAVAAVLTGVMGALAGWIAAEDSAKKGVVIHGYLWIGIWVEPASP